MDTFKQGVTHLDLNKLQLRLLLPRLRFGVREVQVFCHDPHGSCGSWGEGSLEDEKTKKRKSWGQVEPGLSGREESNCPSL